MDLIEVFTNFFTIAFGVVVGTLLTWIVSYFMGKKMLPKMLKSLSKNPEVIRAIQSLKENSSKEGCVELAGVKNACGKGYIFIDHGKCEMCLKCLQVCPFGVLEVKAGKIDITNPENCHFCLACQIECPTHAIKVIEKTQQKAEKKEKVTVDLSLHSCLPLFSLMSSANVLGRLMEVLFWMLVTLIILLAAIYLWSRRKLAKEIISS